ncbi:MAG: hypothetical protein EBV10_09360, partial [Synechococcaceae bacterium WB6_1A_059]|nr:hypothetical protein [Synechococcaceae bacterium WB6_1A_059]
MTAPLFAGVVGHGRALQLLCATLAADRLAPAYLFAGPEGVEPALHFITAAPTAGGFAGLSDQEAATSLRDAKY